MKKTETWKQRAQRQNEAKQEEIRRAEAVLAEAERIWDEIQIEKRDFNALWNEGKERAEELHRRQMEEFAKKEGEALAVLDQLRGAPDLLAEKIEPLAQTLVKKPQPQSKPSVLNTSQCHDCDEETRIHEMCHDCHRCHVCCRCCNGEG